MEFYAGYYVDTEKNLLSTSGGAATLFSELVIKSGGIVYGATYEEDLYSARFDYAEELSDLAKFRGSKYSYVNKIIKRDEKKIGLFEDIYQQLLKGRIVLLIGLGCDIGNMYSFLKQKKFDADNLYTIELLCHGVTSPKVHKDYIEKMESRYNSKVVDFNLRHKEMNWEPAYIKICFENGLVIKKRFDYSEYAYAFYKYKMKSCYKCQYKGIDHHYADIAVGDYWGCIEKMDAYNSTGVSLIIMQREKGYNLLNKVNDDDYKLFKIADYSYALKNNMTYLESQIDDIENSWEKTNNDILNNGLIEFVHSDWKQLIPKRLLKKKYKKIVVWGAGKSLEQDIDEIESIVDIAYICDNNINIQGKKIKKVEIVSPEKLFQEKNVFVIIVANNPNIKIEIINELLNKEIYDFDVFEKWVLYAKTGVFN